MSGGEINWGSVCEVMKERLGENVVSEDDCCRLWKRIAYGDEIETCASSSDEEACFLQAMEAVEWFENNGKKRKKLVKLKQAKKNKPKFFVPHQIVSGTSSFQHAVYSNIHTTNTALSGGNSKDISVCFLSSGSA